LKSDSAQFLYTRARSQKISIVFIWQTYLIIIEGGLPPFTSFCNCWSRPLRKQRTVFVLCWQFSRPSTELFLAYVSLILIERKRHIAIIIQRSCLFCFASNCAFFLSFFLFIFATDKTFRMHVFPYYKEIHKIKRSLLLLSLWLQF